MKGCLFQKKNKHTHTGLWSVQSRGVKMKQLWSFKDVQSEGPGRVVVPQRGLCQPSLPQQAIFCDYQRVQKLVHWYMEAQEVLFFQGRA